MNIEALADRVKTVRKTVAPWNVKESDRIMIFDTFYGHLVPRQISRIEKIKGSFTGSSNYIFYMKNGEVIPHFGRFRSQRHTLVEIERDIYPKIA